MSENQDDTDEPADNPNECGNCNGDGDVRGHGGMGRYTCPYCRGSGLSSAGEARLHSESPT